MLLVLVPPVVAEDPVIVVSSGSALSAVAQVTPAVIVVQVCPVVSKGGCRIEDDRPITSSCGRGLPCFACLANQAILTWMTPYWINFNDLSQGARRMSLPVWQLLLLL